MYYPADCHHCTLLLKGNFQGQKSELKLFLLIQSFLHNMAEDLHVFTSTTCPKIAAKKQTGLPRGWICGTVRYLDYINASTLVVIL